jgi:YVTN family beta-propeller protein
MDIKTDVLKRALSGSYKSSRKQGHTVAGAWFGLAAVMVMLLGAHKAFAGPPVLPGPSHSTNIALTYDNTRVVVANRDVNTVSVIQVRKAGPGPIVDQRIKLAEIPVGIEPHCVAISPDNSKAFVTNAVDGTVSVISLVNYTVLATIPWAPSRGMRADAQRRYSVRRQSHVGHRVDNQHDELYGDKNG